MKKTFAFVVFDHVKSVESLIATIKGGEDGAKFKINEKVVYALKYV